MVFADIPIFLESLKQEIGEIERKYNADPNHGILQSYIGMSSRTKKIILNNINPAKKELDVLNARYSVKYNIKDLSFHIQQANDNLTFLKESIKKIHEAYNNQEPYSKIQESWKALFPSVEKRLKELNSRLFIIERIIKDEF